MVYLLYVCQVFIHLFTRYFLVFLMFFRSTTTSEKMTECPSFLDDPILDLANAQLVTLAPGLRLAPLARKKSRKNKERAV